MKNNIWLRILAGLVLLAAIAGIAFMAYQSGAAQASVVEAQASGETALAPYPYYPYGWGWPPYLSPFGCFIPLIGIFLVFLAFGAFRYMIWGPRWRNGHPMRYHHGPWSWDSENGMPPMFNEWHKQAHSQPPVEGTKE